jgi:hypothetical protein
MSLDQRTGDPDAAHPITRFSHQANAVLDGLVEAPTWILTAAEAGATLVDLTRLQARVAELYPNGQPPTRKQARARLFAYIWSYNTQRLHSTLGYVTPKTYATESSTCP